jgi:ParB-like chromosome segregation protein Spo0J
MTKIEEGRLAALHSKLRKSTLRHLQGKDWVPMSALTKRIAATDAHSHCAFPDMTAVTHRLKSNDRAQRGREKLLEEVLAQLMADGACETREAGEGGQEIRLVESQSAQAESAPVPVEVAVAAPETPSGTTTDIESASAVTEGGEQQPVEVAVSESTDANVDAAELPFHPAATLFPLMSGPDFEKFKDDIRVNGQQEPIWTYRGQGIDGRNRYRACRELGITPATQEWDGPGTLLAFVVSKNLHRRHLDTSQRAMIAARLSPEIFAPEARERMLAGRAQDPGVNLPEGRARDQAAELLNVSPRSVEAASKVLAQGETELIQAVTAGEISVSAAAAVAALPKDEQTKVVAQGADAVKAKAKQVRQQKAAKRDKTPAKKPAQTAAPIALAVEQEGVTQDKLELPWPLTAPCLVHALLASLPAEEVISLLTCAVELARERESKNGDAGSDGAASAQARKHSPEYHQIIEALRFPRRCAVLASHLWCSEHKEAVLARGDGTLSVSLALELLYRLVAKRHGTPADQAAVRRCRKLIRAAEDQILNDTPPGPWKNMKESRGGIRLGLQGEPVPLEYQGALVNLRERLLVVLAGGEAGTCEGDVATSVKQELSGQSTSIPTALTRARAS